MFESLPEELKELEWKVSDLESQIAEYRDLVDRKPIFVVGYKYDGPNIEERKYMGVFSDETRAAEFINGCKLKTPSKTRMFKVKSPLGDFDIARIEYFYVPEHIPFNPVP
jgi:hypothetical protein